jgi:hypothetical protein
MLEMLEMLEGSYREIWSLKEAMVEQNRVIATNEV